MSAFILALSLPLALGQPGITIRTNPVPPAVPAVPTMPPGIQITPAPSVAAPDPLVNLMMAQAAMDAESPPTAETEFDPPVIRLGRQTTYRVMISAMGESVQLPEKIPAPVGLGVTPGGRDQRSIYTGQRMLPCTTVNFRVDPKAPGTYTIPPYSLNVSGKALTIPAARLLVLEANAVLTNEGPQLLVEVPEGDYYVAQTIPVRVTLLDPGDDSVRGLTGVQVGGEAFLADTSVIRQRREVITRNGRTCAAFIQDCYVTAIKEGQQVIHAQGHAIIGRPRGTNLLSNFVYNQPLLDAEPITNTLKRLPKDGELPGFTGGIGAFQLEPPWVSTNAVRAGEPITMTVTVRGEGSLARLIPPKLERVRDWQTFPPLSDGGAGSLYQPRSAVNFTYTLIPLSERIKGTPPIPFSYFDPKRKTYVDFTVPPVPIKVDPAPPGALAQAGTAPAALPNTDADDQLDRERELVMTGLAETPGASVSSLAPMQQRSWFLALQFVPAAMLVGLWLWDRRRRYLGQHPEVVLKHRARRGLRRQLHLLNKAAAARDPGPFVMAGVNALREACAPHEAANPQALVCRDVLEELPAGEQTGRAGELVRKLFTAADAVRFGGTVPDGTQLLDAKPDLERLLQRMRARL